ncbi:MAG: DUF5658 family protein [Peptostreptococcaceae bacterium]
MLKLINNYKSTTIKDKFIFIYTLNITDWIFTSYLINTGFYYEANNLMIHIVDNLLLSILFKVIFPPILLTYIYIRIRNASDAQLKLSSYIINAVVLLYSSVNFLHVVWCLLLPLLTSKI